MSVTEYLCKSCGLAFVTGIHDIRLEDFKVQALWACSACGTNYCIRYGVYGLSKRTYSSEEPFEYFVSFFMHPEPFIQDPENNYTDRSFYERWQPYHKPNESADMWQDIPVDDMVDRRKEMTCAYCSAE